MKNVSITKNVKFIFQLSAKIWDICKCPNVIISTSTQPQQNLTVFICHFLLKHNRVYGTYFIIFLLLKRQTIFYKLSWIWLEERLLCLLTIYHMVKQQSSSRLFPLSKRSQLTWTFWQVWQFWVSTSLVFIHFCSAYECWGQKLLF